MKKFNTWLANKLSDWLSTMVCFYIVMLLVISVLFWQTPRTMLEWVQYSIQAFFQGVALPVLAFVARNEGRKQSKIIKETHDMTVKEIRELRAIHLDIVAEMKLLSEICSYEIQEHKILTGEK